MKQLHLEFMIEEFGEPSIALSEEIQEELIYHMARAIIEVFWNEEGEGDDNLSEQ